jgi:predicted acylesterase/phospholipase RssA
MEHSSESSDYHSHNSHGNRPTIRSVVKVSRPEYSDMISSLAPGKGKPKPVIKTLVLSGGSTKGIAQIGALCLMAEMGLLKSVRRCVATSVGSIISGLFAIGWNLREIKKFLYELDFSKLQELQPKHLFSKLGMDSGRKLMDTVASLIAKKTDVNISLAQVYERFGISLYITTTCLNTGKLVILNRLSTPDLSLLMAMRMSSSIPFIFSPVEYNGALYADGACIDNFPISLFPSPHTIGITINSHYDYRPIRNFEDLMGQVLFVMSNNTSQSTYLYPQQTIYIKTDFKINPNFSMDLFAKNVLFHQGYFAALNWYAREL